MAAFRFSSYLPKLIKWGICCLLLWFFWQVLSWYPDVQPAKVVLIRTLIAGLASLLVGFSFVYRRKSRPSLFADCTFIVLWSSLLLSQLIVLKAKQHEFDTAFAQTINHQRVALRKSILQRNINERAKIQERLERMKTDRYVQYEDQIELDELEKIRQLEETFLTPIKVISEKYISAHKESLLKGVNDWIRTNSLVHLEHQKSQAKELYEITKAFSNQLAAFNDNYEDEIETLSLSEPARRIAVAERERILQFIENAKVETIRRLELDILGQSLQLLDVLIRGWGKWYFDYLTDTLHFEDQKTESNVYELIEQLATTSKTLQEMVTNEGVPN